ncbi:MAG: hypothetical protein RLZZ312_1771 [Bacteroidota bacterium]
MKQKITQSLSVIIPLALGLILTIFFFSKFKSSEKQQMISFFVNADYKYIFLSLILAIVGYVLRAYRWKYTLEQIDCKPNFKLNFVAVSIGYFVNLSVPRAGEVSRALILKKYQNQPFDKVFGTIISERLVDFLILFSFIGIALLIEFQTLQEFLLQYIPIQKLLALAVVGFMMFVFGLYFYKFSKSPTIILLKEKVDGLKVGALSVTKIPHKWSFFGYTLLIWLSYILMFYCATFALKETSQISLGTVLVAFVIGSLTIAFTNGGFGFFPFLIAKILVLYNIPLEAGTAFGWIIWISQLLITVVLGIFAFVVLPIITKSTQRQTIF